MTKDLQAIVFEREARLSDDEVQVWGVSTDLMTGFLEELRGTLSPSERAREKRYRCEADRVRFVVSRGGLRVLVASYLGIDPARLRLSSSADGKPTIGCRPGNGPAIHFNAAHSHELVLYALARDRQVGVDIEFVRLIPDVEQISERIFSPAEQGMIRRASPPCRLEAFFRCWTRKEAYLKARGSGLVGSLHEVQVIGEGESNARGGPVHGVQDAGDWYVHDLEPAPRYFGAIAHEGAVGRVTQHYLWTKDGP